MKYNQVHWELQDANITGMIFDINPGKHTLTLSAIVDRGQLNIPHYNPGLIEHTANPSMVGNVFCVGPESAAERSKKK